MINLFVRLSTRKQILNKDLTRGKNADAILVLGAGVIDNKKPSITLKNRLDKGIEAYQKGLAPKIIMSGDHGRTDYDEVNVMKRYAIRKGVPSDDVFMDHAGFNTYDSIYRAKEIFGVKKIIIATQRYHLYRSLYIANHLGLEAYGVKAAARRHPKMIKYELRELLSTVKNVYKCRKRPVPRYLGEKISLKQSGDVTNDE